MSDLALIVGRGALPLALVQALDAASELRPYVCALDGFLPDGLTPDLIFRIERLVPFLRHLDERGITRVSFAGAVSRPRLDPSLFDAATAQLVPQLMMAFEGGDDATLRAILALFEDSGFAVEGIETLAPQLLPEAGVLAGKITSQAEADATRAAEIVAALGAADVGQGAVVSGGLCLAVEALPGTDVMLAQVAALPEALRPAGQGLAYKAAKPSQDRRVDLPTIGLTTLHGVAAAGLSGLAFQAGSVICLDLAQMQAEAERLGVFLWAR
ncbi:MAG: LpxI family protein [Cypionkella sp.]